MLISLRLFLAVLIFSAASSTAFAGPRCEAVFRVGGKTSVDSAAPSLGRTPPEILEYRRTQNDFRSLMSQLPAERRQNLEELVIAAEFYDYVHMAPKLVDNYLRGGREMFDFSSLYGPKTAFSSSERQAPFNGYKSARQFLIEERPTPTIETLRAIHSRIMAGGVEGIKPAELGTWREIALIGNAVGNARVTSREIQIINDNPYLGQFKLTTVDPPSSSFNWNILSLWGSGKRIQAKTEAEALHQGQILYPSVLQARETLIEGLRIRHPELHREVMDARARNTTTPQLEARLTEALVIERFERFEQDRAALGTIEIGRNDRQYSDLVADFQRDLVSIHPFRNGNGRTTRLFMNYLLTREGLPPARLENPNLDIQTSPQGWRDQVYRGSLNTAQLLRDLTVRVRTGLTPEHSPELLYPAITESVSISQKKQGNPKVLENFKEVPVESAQFTAFVKTLTEMHPELAQEMQTNRALAMSRLNELFTEFIQSKTISYIHSKDGTKDIKLRLIESDFVDLFGVMRSPRKDLWDAKIDRWYDRETLVWRGLADRNNVQTDAQLVEYFKRPAGHLASNQVLRSRSSGRSVVELMREDFKTYNREMLDGKLLQMADDHHKEGPRYGTSYGFSTSKREVVGKAFAMGAMVIAEYGKHQDPALQAQLKSRINIAAYKADKDVDLGRLKAFDQSFSYIYGRQAEVMGIGGTDGDAVMVVQRIDAAGTVQHSFVRNLQKPVEVMMIEGRYVPGEGPLPAARVLKTFNLETGAITEGPLRPAAQEQAQPRPQVENRPVEPVVAPQPVQKENGLLNGVRKMFGW